MLKVYGSSDDLIEIEGEPAKGEPFDEFGCYGRFDDDEGFLSFSDGTVLSVKYNGQWLFRVKQKGDLFDHKDDATDDDSNYSDVAYFKDGVKWAMLGTHYAFGKKDDK